MLIKQDVVHEQAIICGFANPCEYLLLPEK